MYMYLDNNYVIYAYNVSCQTQYFNLLQYFFVFFHIVYNSYVVLFQVYRHVQIIYMMTGKAVQLQNQ